MRKAIFMRRLPSHIVALVVVVLIFVSCNRNLFAADDIIFRYDNMLYPDGDVFIKQFDGIPSKSWGLIGYAGSDAWDIIGNCASEEVDFCMSVPGGLYFSYQCHNLRVGATWLSQGWKFIISPHHSVTSEYFIIARKNDVIWHFILSKTKGVVELIRLEDPDKTGEVNAKNIWRASNFGFGKIDQNCGNLGTG
ncbi:MAG: hypothetical protein COA93_07890 [Alphaproteobacteria bacterium]|nr:MAG: hypothetical protein COA93_07890 [Alphaproteobacteria bacterium]